MICKVKKAIFLLLFFVIGLPLASQNIAIKNNVLYDLTTTLNFGVEARFAPQWTAEISGNYNPFAFRENTKWKHWMLQPEGRYWFCDRFSRHFIGAHLIAGAFNFGGIDNNIAFFGTDFSVLTDKRYQGYAYGGGLAYGFAYMLSRHLNLEFEAGFGYMYLDYETYDCTGCGRKVKEGVHHYVGPTKAAINIVYVF